MAMDRIWTCGATLADEYDLAVPFSSTPRYSVETREVCAELTAHDPGGVRVEQSRSVLGIRRRETKPVRPES